MSCTWCAGPMEPADVDQDPPYCSALCREERERKCQYGHDHRTARDASWCYELQMFGLTMPIRTAPDVVFGLLAWRPDANLTGA